MPLTTPLKRPTLFSQKKYLSQKTKQKKKNKWLLENRILILTTPRRLQQSEKFLYIKQKLESKWDEIMIVIFQEKKSEQKQIDGEYFFVSVHAVY